MATVTQEFQSAPMGRRVVATTILSFAGILAVFAVNLRFAFKKFSMQTALTERTAVTLAPLAALLIAMPVFMFERSRVARFRIEENCLVLGRKRFPLAGLSDIARDPEVMRRAARVWGNGGVGSIRGHFRSKRLGKFYAFMTGTENAVVLRWPDRIVAVSPQDPEFFIFSARSAAGLR